MSFRVKPLLMLILCLSMLAFAPMVVFAETFEEEPVQPASETKAEETYLEVSTPHWFNFVWRSGFGGNGSGLTLQYKDLPGGDEDDEFYATGGGAADSHMATFWFYPTAGRHLLLSFSAGFGSGRGTLTADDDPSQFLDEKDYWCTYYYLPLGVGYRWLVGPLDQVSLNLYFELGIKNTFLNLEGADEQVLVPGGGSGLVFSAHYRYTNGLLLGGSLDLRSSSGTRTDATLADQKVDVGFDQSMIFFGIVVGYEPGGRM